MTTPYYSDESGDDADLVDQIARTLVEAGCNDPWHTVKRCARALLPLVREQVEAARADARNQATRAELRRRGGSL